MPKPLKVADPFVFVEYRLNGQYFGGNYRTSEIPAVLGALRKQCACGGKLDGDCVSLDDIATSLNQSKASE